MGELHTLSLVGGGGGKRKREERCQCQIGAEKGDRESLKKCEPFCKGGGGK